MKKSFLLGIVGLLCIASVALRAHRGDSDRGCSRKLDALNATLQRVEVTAAETESLLAEYQESCCESCADILRSEIRAPQCLCEVTPITGPVYLDVPGSYCLANDIVGSIIAGASVQVSIDLKGHTVDGVVQVGEHGYVHDGTITGDLVLLSYGRADRVQVGARLLGTESQDVLVQNSLLTYPATSGYVIDNFTSLTLDHCTIALEGEASSSAFNVQNVVNLMMRSCYVFGDMQIDLSALRKLETLSIYDSHITGKLSVYPHDALSALAIWDSAIHDFYLNMSTPFGSPAIVLHGVTSSHIGFNAIEQHPATRILVDECSGGRFVFQRVSNIHCQNTIANASPSDGYTSFAPVHIESCQNGFFSGVNIFNPLESDETTAVKIFDSKNLLFTKCYATASSSNGKAYDVTVGEDAVGTCTSINFCECVAKDSHYGFYVSGELTTGYTKNCVADGCLGGFVPNYSNVPTVFSDNVACFNTMNYGAGSDMPPYYNVAYTVTAGSWRNISL